MSASDEEFTDSAGEEYEVESIAAHRKSSRRVGVDYLIKWKGYDESENTWEHETNVHAPELIEAYWEDKGGREGQEASRRGKRQQPQRKERPVLRRDKTSSSPDVSGDLSYDHGDSVSSVASPTEQQLSPKLAESKKQSKALSPEAMEVDTAGESDKEKEDKTTPQSSLDDVLTAKAPKDLNPDDIIFDKNYPPDGDLIDWEDKVAAVEYMVCDPDDNTTVYVVLRWKNGDLSMHPRKMIHSKCPHLLLDYYEKRLTFPGVNSVV